MNNEQGQQAREYLEQKAVQGDVNPFWTGICQKYSNDLYLYLKKKGYSDQILKETGLLTCDENRVLMTSSGIVSCSIMDVNNKVIGFGGRVKGDGTPEVSEFTGNHAF